MIDRISSINVVIKNVADDTYDDLFSKVPVNYKDRVQHIATQVYDYIKNTNATIDQYYSVAPKDVKKEFMLWVDANVPRELRGHLRNKYLNKEIHPVKKLNGGYRSAKEIGITFDE